MGKILTSVMFTFLENALDLGVFIQDPLSHSKLTPMQMGITHSLRKNFFENYIPPTAESGGGNYGFLYQNSIRKCEDDLEY